jgi:predicted nucleotidyltransferase
MREAFIAVLKETTPDIFLEQRMFDCVPELFTSDREQFVQWKRILAGKLDVDPACITIVGSAAFGRSLNPSKNLKAFDKDSDIDVAVISPHHFAVGWRYLRMNGKRRYEVPTKTKNAWDDHVKKYIYWGTIATDRLLGVLPFGLDWLAATRLMASHPATLNRTINLRIYNDYDALRAYQLQSVKSARDAQLG